VLPIAGADCRAHVLPVLSVPPGMPQSASCLAHGRAHRTTGNAPGAIGDVERGTTDGDELCHARGGVGGHHGHGGISPLVRLARSRRQSQARERRARAEGCSVSKTSLRCEMQEGTPQLQRNSGYNMVVYMRVLLLRRIVSLSACVRSLRPLRRADAPRRPAHPPIGGPMQSSSERVWLAGSARSCTGRWCVLLSIRLCPLRSCAMCLPTDSLIDPDSW
jgi:hypothetical protein